MNEFSDNIILFTVGRNNLARLILTENQMKYDWHSDAFVSARTILHFDSV